MHPIEKLFSKVNATRGRESFSSMLKSSAGKEPGKKTPETISEIGVHSNITISYSYP